MSQVAWDHPMANLLFSFSSLIAEGLSDSFLMCRESSLTLPCFDKEAKRLSHLGWG